MKKTQSTSHPRPSDGNRTNEPAALTAEAQQVEIAKLVPRRDNREVADDAALAELADSLRIVGQLHPIHIRPLADGSFEILAGVRRWLASKKNGATDILAIVHEGCDEATSDAIRFAENTHRADPSALDTARELRRIKNLNGFTHAEVAQHTSISIARVKQYLGLFSASDALLEAVESRALPISIAVELVRYEKACGELASRKLLKRVVAGDISVREVAALRKRVGGAMTSQESAKRPARDPWAAVEARIAKLVASDPKAARPKVKALAAALDAMLQEGAP